MSTQNNERFFSGPVATRLKQIWEARGFKDFDQCRSFLLAASKVEHTKLPGTHVDLSAAATYLGVSDSWVIEGEGVFDPRPQDMWLGYWSQRIGLPHNIGMDHVSGSERKPARDAILDAPNQVDQNSVSPLARFGCTGIGARIEKVMKLRGFRSHQQCDEFLRAAAKAGGNKFFTYDLGAIATYLGASIVWLEQGKGQEELSSSKEWRAKWSKVVDLPKSVLAVTSSRSRVKQTANADGHAPSQPVTDQHKRRERKHTILVS